MRFWTYCADVLTRLASARALWHPLTTSQSTRRLEVAVPHAGLTADRP